MARLNSFEDAAFGEESVSHELQRILVSATRHYECYAPKLSLVGPIYIGANHRSSLGHEIDSFRSAYSAVHAPYLANEFHQALELRLDRERLAAHFVVKSRGTVAALLRVRVGVFEFPHLAAELGTAANQVAEYAEYSRLMVEGDDRLLRIGRALLARATLWACRETHARGIVALCRRESARVFAGFGLRPVLAGDVELLQRNGALYRLMAASWNEIRDKLDAHAPFEVEGNTAKTIV